MIAVMVILGLTIFMFVSEVVRVDVAAVSIMVLLGLTSLVPGYSGLVPLEHLFDGYSSQQQCAKVSLSSTRRDL